MSEVNKLFKLLRRTVLMVLLAGLISLIALPAASVQAFPFLDNSSTPEDLNKTGNRPYGERGDVNILQADKSNDVNSDTVKRIQEKAEDKVGSRPIGDTGLKNIRNLGENVPKIIDRNVRQTLGESPSDAINDVQ